MNADHWPPNSALVSANVATISRSSALTTWRSRKFTKFAPTSTASAKLRYAREKRGADTGSRGAQQAVGARAPWPFPARTGLTPDDVVAREARPHHRERLGILLDEHNVAAEAGGRLAEAPAAGEEVEQTVLGSRVHADDPAQ